MKINRMSILLGTILILSGIIVGCTTNKVSEAEGSISHTKTSQASTNISNSSTTTATHISPTPTSDNSNVIWTDGVSTYAKIPCRFDKPTGFEIECGVLTVPEDRSKPEGNMVELHVAVYKSRSDNPLPDPVIYLTGGGGGNELENGDIYLDDGNDAILDQRDFIMFNQRGTKFTNPYLQCHRLNNFYTELALEDISLNEADARIVDYMRDCYDSFIEKGINLDMYNTARNAEDLNDLRIALGYDEINIYGTSYGTRYALYAMRMFGDRIRSAIIDSVFPPQIHFFRDDPVNVYITFQNIFSQCEADAYCSTQYPDIEKEFYALIDRLNANPRSIRVYGISKPIPFNGTDLLIAVYYYPYLGKADEVPKAIFKASQGNFYYIDPYIPFVKGLVGSEGIAIGVQNSILCREEAPFDSYEQLQEALSDLPPQFAEAYDTTYWYDLCEAWDVSPADSSEKEAVVSDIPTLILAGEFDPITPTYWSQLAGETLTNSYYYEFPNHGHGIMRSDKCGFEIGMQFLNDPETQPDSSCLDNIAGIEFK